MDDQQIIAMYRERDEHAIEETAAKYGRLCLTVATNLLASPEDANECVNDTWLAVWNTIPPEEPESLTAYICRITRNLAMKRLRLTYDDLAAANPRIIYAGVFGYGQDGPYAEFPAYDDLIQGAIGLPALIGRIGDGVPRYVPLVFVDRAVGLAAVNSITAALFHRERTGRGQSIEIPMFETMVPTMLADGNSWLMKRFQRVIPAGPTNTTS